MPYFKVAYFLYYCRNRQHVPRNITEHYHYADNGFAVDVFVLIFSLADFGYEFSRLNFYTRIKVILGAALLGLIHFTCYCLM